MSLSVVHTVNCNNKSCSKKLTSPKSIGDLFKQAKASGWEWRSSKLQNCPDHATVKKSAKAKPAKKAVKKVVAKKTATKKKVEKPLIDVAAELEKQELNDEGS